MDLDKNGYLTHKVKKIQICSSKIFKEISTFIHKELKNQGELNQVPHHEELAMVKDILSQEDKDRDGRISRMEFSGEAHREF